MVDLDRIRERQLQHQRQHELSDWRQGLAIAAVSAVLGTVSLNAGPGWRRHAFGLFLVALISCVVAILAKWRLSKLSSIRAQYASATGDIQLDAAIAMLPDRELLHRAHEIDQHLVQSAPPRRVALASRGTLWTILFLVGFGGAFTAFAYLLVNRWNWQQWREEFLAFALPAMFFLAMLVYSLAWIRRDRALLATGNVALAIVIERRRISNSRGYSYTQVRYKFRDPEGQLHDGKGAEYSGFYSEGNAVAVFYDPANPKRQVPYCGSFHRVVFTHGDFREKNREFIGNLRRL
jgi:hypothetical protein